MAPLVPMVRAANLGSFAVTPGIAALTIGTSDKITTLDPAGAYDNGSFTVMNQVYPFLMNTPPGSPDVEPDIAESADFTAPTDFTVKLKPGLKFANGHDLTSSDVKFSFDRIIKINDANGPASLLANLASTDAPDDTTVVFHLKVGNDQTFAQILSTNAGPIVGTAYLVPPCSEVSASPAPRSKCELAIRVSVAVQVVNAIPMHAVGRWD